MPVTLSLQVRGARIVHQGLQNLRAEVPRIGAQRIYDRLQKARERLRKPGRRIGYPVQWDSDRQRKAYYASGGFGRGIPSQRTGAYQRGWIIRRNPGVRQRAGWSLINPEPHAEYVGGNAYGEQQSSIHRGRWPLVRDEVERAVAGLPEEIEEHIAMVARREGLT